MSKRISPFDGPRDAYPTTAKRPRTPANDGVDLAVKAPNQGQKTHHEYHVGVICALVCESVAFQAFLDETHDRPAIRQPYDNNDYTLGRLGEHNVVIAVLPGGIYGTTSATAAAQDLKRAFPSVEFGLMVGLGGGAPNKNHDIRLGDVVVSQPKNGRGGVFQYDFGKLRQGQAFDTTGSFLNQPPTVLLSAVSGLESQYRLHGNQFDDAIKQVLQRKPGLREEYKRPHATTDILYRSDILHPVGSQLSCSIACSRNPEALTTRPERPKGAYCPVIHYGLIASANTLMRDALARDKLAEEEGVLCFEMEAAGLMNNWPCLVIRGICDYADTHKNKEWQGYAAMAAAAYARDLLRRIPGLAKTKDRISVNDLPIQVPSQRDEAYQDNEEQRRSLLNALKFDKMNDRQETIRKGHAKTCKWLLQTNEYRSWLDPNQRNDHLGFLWMKGKPGAGKSTLMKFLYTNAQKTMKDKIVISFFFNARGVDLEKSTIGMYRHLLRQLFEKLPKLLDVFNIPGISMPLNHEWNIESLKAILEQAILLLDDSCVVCFIDALDECAEDEIRDMISFFEQLSKNAISHGIGFQICFASRLYPTISIEKSVTFDLKYQYGHSQDIKSYIETELKIGKSALANEVRSEVEKKASGVFLWVCLVVQILNKTADTGYVDKLKLKLREIPGTLHELFRDVLQRDEDNKDELLLCLQLVLFAAQPLEPTELYFAIQSSNGPEILSLWKAGEITPSVIKRFILNSSKGLTELTASETPTVQFIHESVRDFLLKENGLRDNWFNPGEDVYTESHERLKNCCVDYINADAVTAFQLPRSVTKQTIRQMGNIRNSIERAFPFLRYAVEHVFHHANLAGHCGRNQSRFLQNFPRVKWIQIDNLYQQAPDRHQVASLLYILAERNFGLLIRHHPQIRSCFKLEWERYHAPFLAALGRRNDEAIRAFLEALAERQSFTHPTDNLCERYYGAGDDVPDFRKHAIFSERNHEDTILDLLYRLDNEVIMHAFLMAYDFENMHVQKHCKSPLFWAIAKGQRHLLEVMLDRGANIESFQGPKPWLTPLCSAAAKGQDAIIKFLLERGANPNPDPSTCESPLPLAVRHGHESTVSLLLDLGFDIDADSHLTTMSNAVQSGRESMMRLCLSKGAKVDWKINHNDIGMTPLMYAARAGSVDICKLLIANGASLTSRDSYALMPIHHAMKEKHENLELLECMVKKGVDIDVADGRGKTLLSFAIAMGLEACVEFFLKRGANIESKDNTGRTPLSWAASQPHCIAIVRLLVDSGANIDSKDENGRTPLFLAASTPNGGDITKLLLNSGADFESRDNTGRTPLSPAVFEYNIDTTKLLLNSGADFESRDNSGWTPLSWAAFTHYGIDTTKLLLDSGANFESRDNTGWAPLSRAVSAYNIDTTKLLLNSGADLESRDNSGRTPLSWAVSTLDRDITKLLLDSGADFESRDNSGRTPLSWAVSAYHRDTTKLLLNSGADFESRDNSGRTPLSWAVSAYDRDITELLLISGADLESRDNTGRTPLSWAAAEGYFDAVELLLRYGADPGMDDNWESSPLRLAVAHNRYYGLIERLLKVKAELVNK